MNATNNTATKMLFLELTTLFMFIQGFSSCREAGDTAGNDKKNGQQTITGTAVTFSPVHSKAILLGETLQLLDTGFNVLKDIGDLNEQFVKVTALSDQYHKTKSTDNYCQEFKYAKIKIGETEGYIDGRNLYEPIKHVENKTVVIADRPLSFTTTRNFGIGASDNDGLTGCSVRTPAIFTDPGSNYEGVITMEKNEYTEGDYPYLELRNDDGAYDKIERIYLENDTCFLSLNRKYQEGSGKFLISIFKDESGSFKGKIVGKSIRFE